MDENQKQQKPNNTENQEDWLLTGEWKSKCTLCFLLQPVGHLSYQNFPHFYFF